MEEFGSVSQLHESMNGNQGNLVYLIDRDYNEIIRQYEEIKQAKVIVGSYATGMKHCLVLFVGGIVKKKVVRRKK